VPRLIVIVFACTIALFSNGLRIAIIGLLSHYQLTENIHGPGHLLQGMFVSALGLIAVHAAVMFMARRYPKPQHHLPAASRPVVAMPRWRLLAAVSVASVIVVASSLQPPALAPSIARHDERAELAPKWRLLDSSAPMPFVAGGPMRNTGRTFQTSPGRTLDLYTGDLVFADPAGGLGYRHVALPTRSAMSEMPVPTATGMVFVNRFSFRAGEQDTDVAFWYDDNGTAISQVTTAKLATLWSLATGTRPLPTLVVIARTRKADADDAAEPMERIVTEVFDAIQLRRSSGNIAAENNEP
jgi:hypothetical protein